MWNGVYLSVPERVHICFFYSSVCRCSACGCVRPPDLTGNSPYFSRVLYACGDSNFWFETPSIKRSRIRLTSSGSPLLSFRHKHTSYTLRGICNLVAACCVFLKVVGILHAVDCLKVLSLYSMRLRTFHLCGNSGFLQLWHSARVPPVVVVDAYGHQMPSSRKGDFSLELVRTLSFPALVSVYFTFGYRDQRFRVVAIPSSQSNPELKGFRKNACTLHSLSASR